MKYFDRFEQKKLISLPQEIWQGGYIAIPEQGDHINEIKCEVGKEFYIVPDKNFACEVFSNEKKSFHQFSKESNSFDAGVRINLENISIELDSKTSWEEITEIIPLIRNVDKILQLNNFEKQLQEWFFHIQEVCYKPEMKLTRTSEKMPVSRAKRIPLRAINYLAAHSEDWERRRFRSVIPKSIISERLEDEIKIYENIVTARLIDHLLYYVQDRINGIHRINRFQKTLEKILKDHSAGNNNQKRWFQKIERTYQLCGDAYFAILDKSDKPQALKFLESIENELLKLRNSELYKSINKKYRISGALRKTNLFTSHKHYKYIALLWEKWISSNKVETKQERFDNLQKLNQSFFDFSILVIFRAIEQLEFTPVETDFDSWREKELSFTSNKKYPWANLKLKIVNNRGIDLIINQKVFKYIPIIDYIPKENAIADKTILLHYSQEKNFANDTDNQIFISPEDIDSIEKVARIIRKEILKEVIAYYPVKVDLHINSLELALNKIRGIEITEENRKKKIIISDSVSKESFNPIFNKAKQELKSYGKQKAEDIRRLEDTRKELENKSNELENNVNHCIQCNGIHNKNFTSREHDCFIYECSCGCEWGIEIKDEIRIPFFHVKNYKEIEKSIYELGMDFLYDLPNPPDS
jgi:hypothetical protein